LEVSPVNRLLNGAHNSLAAALVAVAFALLTTSCGGASAAKPLSEFEGTRLPPEATKKVKMNRAKCLKGDAQACDWVGVWFQVGGAGGARRGDARVYFKRACDKNHQPGCAHLRNMQDDDNQ
jgi:hypothetical protein